MHKDVAFSFLVSIALLFIGASLVVSFLSDVVVLVAGAVALGAATYATAVTVHHR